MQNLFDTKLIYEHVTKTIIINSFNNVIEFKYFNENVYFDEWFNRQKKYNFFFEIQRCYNKIALSKPKIK